jgi:hypothetical protein
MEKKDKQEEMEKKDKQTKMKKDEQKDAERACGMVW